MFEFVLFSPIVRNRQRSDDCGKGVRTQEIKIVPLVVLFLAQNIEITSSFLYKLFCRNNYNFCKTST